MGVITGRLERSGQGYVVAVPAEDVARLGLVEGQVVEVDLRPAGSVEALTPDLRDAFEIELERGRAGLRYLAEH